MRRGGVYALFLLFLISALGINGFFAARAHAKTRVETNVFIPGAADNIGLLTGFESTLGLKFNAAMWYQDWSTNVDPTEAKNFYNSGHIPELTWEPQINGVGVSYDAVVAGSYDAYITSMAQSVAALGFPIRISLAPEMNTDWTPWGIGLQGNNADNFKLFWRHVVQKFRDAGTTNVQWIWSPNVTPDNAATLYGNYSNIYPGDSYVDFMGMDGYNWGSSQSWSVWQSFSDVFGSSYKELTAMSSKNIILMEVASTELGGSKAAWITDMFNQLQTNFSHIVGFTWFDINKETDWRINSSTTAQAAFVAGYNVGNTTIAGKAPVSAGTTGSKTVKSSTKTAVANTATPAASSTSPAPTTTVAMSTNPANQLYPVTTPLKPKIAGTIVASASLTQELGATRSVTLFGSLLLGMLAVFTITLRRHREFSYSGPAPNISADMFGIGLVDSVFLSSRFKEKSQADTDVLIR